MEAKVIRLAELLKSGEQFRVNLYENDEVIDFEGMKVPVSKIKEHAHPLWQRDTNMKTGSYLVGYGSGV